MVLKRMLKPRAAVPMGFALGLLVLWELGAIPIPFDPDAGPIERAALAVGLAVAGAVIGYGIHVVAMKLFGDRS
jgi:hypothetical protein